MGALPRDPLRELVGLVAPPPEPVAASGDWDAVEQSLGVRLPRDFKALTGRYGAGSFCDFVRPLSPFYEPCLMAGEVAGILAGERGVRDAFPDEYPLPLYPEPGGLLPWAVTDNGDRLYWSCEGSPGRWPVVVRPSRGPGHWRFETGAVGFIAGWLAGRIACPCFPDDVVEIRFFDPHRELRHLELRLSESRAPFDDRLARVQQLLAPIEDRGAFASDQGCQVHFLGTAGRWKVTYETLYGHRLRLAVPPADTRAARARAREIARALGVRILGA